MPVDDEVGKKNAEGPKPQNKWAKFISEQWLMFCFGMACLFAWRWPSE